MAEGAFFTRIRRFYETGNTPGRERLLDCTPGEVRALVQQRYRTFWGLPEWRALHAYLPVLPMLDDHEIANNWDSDPAHAAEPWRSVGEGARAAYLDYQGSRMRPGGERPPDCFDWSHAYGPIALHALDLRSQRRAEPAARIVSEAQLAGLQAFLAAESEREVLAVVLSLPLLHLPPWAARLATRLTRAGEDFSDRSAIHGHVRDRDHVLHLLLGHARRHPHQRILLLSRDIHIACAHELRPAGEARVVLRQLLSSGITHGVSPVVAALSRLSILANRGVRSNDGRLAAAVRPLRGLPRRRRNGWGRRNIGLLELRRRGDGRFDLAFSVHCHERDAPREVYRSPWIPPPVP